MCLRLGDLHTGGVECVETEPWSESKSCVVGEDGLESGFNISERSDEHVLVPGVRIDLGLKLKTAGSCRSVLICISLSLWNSSQRSCSAFGGCSVAQY